MGPTVALVASAPACAYAFQPQHATWPPARIAHCVLPGAAASRVAGPGNGTRTGNGLVVPLAAATPTCPRLSSPQHQTEPSVLRAHAELKPRRTSAASANGVCASASTARAKLASVPSPRPRIPSTSKPQHDTPPAVVTAQNTAAPPFMLAAS